MAFDRERANIAIWVIIVGAAATALYFSGWGATLAWIAAALAFYRIFILRWFFP